MSLKVRVGEGRVIVSEGEGRKGWMGKAGV